MKTKNKSPTYVLYNIYNNKTDNKYKNNHKYKNKYQKMKIKNYKIFNLAINEESGETKVVLGNNLIDTLPNEDKAKSKIDKKPWEYIFKLIVVVVNNILEQKKEEKNENK